MSGTDLAYGATTSSATPLRVRRSAMLLCWYHDTLSRPPKLYLGTDFTVPVTQRQYPTSLRQSSRRLDRCSTGAKALIGA
eukprot:1660945-Rhodomonas_salina.2